MNYAEAFDYVLESSTFKRKETLDNDLRLSSVRQLEMARSFIDAINISDDSVNVLYNIAQDAGIEDSLRGLDKDRHKLKMNGPFDLVIAFGGALIRYLKRIELSISHADLIKLQRDALRTLTLALVDCKIANGRGKSRLYHGYQALISEMCLLDKPLVIKRIVRPNQAMMIADTNVNKEFVKELYVSKVKGIMDSIKLSQSNIADTSSSSTLPALLQHDCCGEFNLGVAGAGHVRACQSEDKTHIDRFHKCLICGKKHPVYNCPWLRCMMRLTPYNAYYLGQQFKDETLPPPQSRFSWRGGRGRGRGRGGRGRGRPQKPGNNGGQAKNGQGRGNGGKNNKQQTN